MIYKSIIKKNIHHNRSNFL